MKLKRITADISAEGQKSKVMKAVKSKGSLIEVALAKALWEKGYRYRKNDPLVFGKPDLTFRKHKIAVFVDSEFWHGYDWEVHKTDHKTNKEYWIKKIERNIQRDKQVNKVLKESGWLVLRFWGKDIENNLLLCVKKFEEAFHDRQTIQDN